MKDRSRRALFLATFTSNAFALLAGIAGFLQTYGQHNFFTFVLIVSPILSMVILADYPWEKPNRPAEQDVSLTKP
jgi:hypothetical protein